MKTVVAGALGECVHVAGVTRFLRLAESAGWRTIFLGPATPIQTFLEVAQREQAELVGVSYRLTPENGERLLGEFAEAAAELHAAGVRFAFGGTPPVAERAQHLQFFERTFDGTQPDEDVLAYLKGSLTRTTSPADYPQEVIERIRWKAPFPLLRHHFGLPDMESTLAGVAQIAEARLLDVISLGVDQDTQENFFHPERQDPRRRGAGGAPVRNEADLRALYSATRSGNVPLLRIYSGTDDFIRLAELFTATIHNAWCAIPLFWFNQMDGRGPWDLESSIRQHQDVMAWYGQRGIPVELNEPHHWGMRDAPDIVFVVAAYLSAYNARASGVQDYIAQLMFNSPPETSDAMDLAKMLAILELIAPLEDEHFRIWRQTRTGLLSYPVEISAARAHLAASIYVQMALRPHIIHIVSHTEADHAATADDILEATRMARRSIANALQGQPDLTSDPRILERKNTLITEAKTTLSAIGSLARGPATDPFADPSVLARAVAEGILDAPQLKNNPFGRGVIRTQVIAGACQAVDNAGQILTEEKRLFRFIREQGANND